MLHHSFKRSSVHILALTAICLTTFAFAKPGGDHYEIYLNNKLLLKQYAYQPLTLQSLQLTKENMNDNLVIIYSHCGVTGKGRSIAIRNEKGTILKEWKFADATGSNKGMTIPVKELLELEKQVHSDNLSLTYASQELPKGKVLASI